MAMISTNTNNSVSFCWGMLLVWGAWIAQNFWATGMVTADQLDFSLDGLSADLFSRVLWYAKEQGRIYFLFTKIVDLVCAAYPDCLLTKITTISLFMLAPICFSYVVFNNVISRLLFTWGYFNVVSVGCDHLPPSSYPIVTSLPFVFCALAALAIKKAGKDAGWPSPARLAVVFLMTYISFFQYEPITALSFFMLLWAIYTGNADARGKKILYGVVVSALLVYVVSFVVWRFAFPTSYDGSDFGKISIFEVLRVTTAYSLGGLPLLNKVPPLLWGDSLIGKTVLPVVGNNFMTNINAIEVHTVIIFAIAAACVVRLIRFYGIAPISIINRNLKISYYVISALFVLALFLSANGLIAMSYKYQQLASGSTATYLTSQLALLPFGVAGVLLLEIAGRLVPARAAGMLPACAAVFLGALGVLVFTSNSLAAPRLKANLARWEAVSLLASHQDRQGYDKLLVPQLYFSGFSSHANWSEYWKSYVRKRFDKELNFYANPAGERDLSKVRLYHADDGQLKAVTVQTADTFQVIYRHNAPPLLVYAEETGSFPVGLANNKRSHSIGYRSIVYDKFSLQADYAKSTLKLSWSVPESAITPQQSFAELIVPASEIRDAVNSAYRLYLGREADPRGLDFYSVKTADAGGSLLRVIEEFERIKGESSPEQDLKAVIETLGINEDPTSERYSSGLKMSATMKPFGRRWLLFKQMKSE